MFFQRLYEKSQFKNPLTVSLLFFIVLGITGCGGDNHTKRELSLALNMEYAYLDSYFQNMYPGFRKTYPDYKKLTVDELLLLLKHPDWSYAAPAFTELNGRKDPASFQCLVILIIDPLQDYRYRESAREIIQEVSGILPTWRGGLGEMEYKEFMRVMAEYGELAEQWLEKNYEGIPRML